MAALPTGTSRDTHYRFMTATAAVPLFSEHCSGCTIGKYKVCRALHSFTEVAHGEYTENCSCFMYNMVCLGPVTPWLFRMP